MDTGTARFIVKNKSNSVIDSLYFGPSDSISRQYIKLAQGEKQEYNLSMAGLTSDGAYSIIYRRADKKILKRFGYFTNGMALEKYTEVEILNDTIIFKPEY